MNKLIRFLKMKSLGLKKWEMFRFNNQKSNCYYYFDNEYFIMKIVEKDRVRQCHAQYDYIAQLTKEDITRTGFSYYEKYAG